MNCSCLKLSKGECCGTCRWGFCYSCTYPNLIQCRRHAPNPAQPTDMFTRGQWPNVSRGDICGDYEKDADPGRGTT
jgi:hypothetical protein